MEKIWLLILEKLKEYSPDDYVLWFSQLSFQNISKNSLYLSVSSVTTQKTILERFKKVIEDFSSDILGFDTQLEIEIQTSKENTLFEEVLEEDVKQIKPRKKVSKNIDSIILNRKFTFERFVPGSNSDLAYKAAQYIVQIKDGVYDRFNPLFIYGGVGLGKTHILQAIGNYILENKTELQVTYVTAEKYMNDYIEASITKKFQNFRDFYRNTDFLLIDDIQFLENKEKLQDEIFNNFNYLHQSNKQIVFTCDKHPKDLKNVQERLISRFSWGLSVDIKAPDFETRKNIIEKKLSENELIEKMPNDIILFLAENITQNIRDIESAVAKITSILLLTNNQISISLLKEELKDILTKTKVETLGLSLHKIQETVCQYYSSNGDKISISDLKSKSRTNRISFIRHMAIFVSKNILPYSLSKIGEEFGNRDHSTVLSSIKKIEKEIKITSSVRHDYEEILKLLTYS